MRVTLVTRDFPPRAGGIADHSMRLAHALADEGHQVSVVAGAPASGDDTIAVTLADPFDPKSVATTAAATRPEAVLWQYNPFSAGPKGLATHAAATAKALARLAPLTVFAHELWFPWGRAGARGLVWAPAQRIQTRRALAHAAAWIVTTPSRERALRRIDPARTHLIPVGTNIEPAGVGRGAARTSLGLDNGAFIVAHLGSAGPGRDLGPAFHAIGALRERGIDARLILAGDTGPLAIPDEVAAHVIAPGPQPHRDLSVLLHASDVYLHADPVGPAAGRRTTLVAALAHGLPVLAYQGPDAAPELTDVTRMCARDARDVTDALAQLHAGPELRASMGAASLATFEKHFSWRRIATGVEAVLTSGARNRPR